MVHSELRKSFRIMTDKQRVELAKQAEVELKTGLELMGKDKKTIKDLITSKAEVNKLIDTLLHPLFNRNPTFIMLDSILHGLAEQNPLETLLKFMHYNLPKIIKEITR